ncbi:MAG: hypothetical protein BGO69_00350 [Bacteroidetes bacterium 46-16]|nr:MAG: hypothetical protein BGO69_00350 [Bacteroidetes bacterium 46-16]
MKFVKLSIFALTLGLFITSCGNSENQEAATEDSAAMAPAPAPEAAPEAAPMADTTAAPAADTTKAMENK